MGRVFTSTTFRKAETPEELVGRFAALLRSRYGATIYLFGSRARGTHGEQSDYDIVAVADSFRRMKPTSRVVDRVTLWFEAGGWGQALDLHCYTPEEFTAETVDGLGYLGQALERGELVLVPTASTPTGGRDRPDGDQDRVADRPAS